MSEFIDYSAENGDDDTDNGYYHPELIEQMALAAAQVFDATFKSQKYAKEQETN